MIALVLVGMLATFGLGRLGAGSARADATAATSERDDAVAQQTSLERELDGRDEAIATLQGELQATEELLDAARSEADTSAGRVGDLEDQLEETREAVTAAEQQAEGADARALEEARQAVREENRKKDSQLDERSMNLDRRKSRLDQREQELDERAAALDDAEAELERNTFGNGVWEIGVDVEPGKYKSDGGDPCYWAKLDYDNEIIDNEIGEGPKVVVLDNGILFESSRCADWRKVD